MIKLRLIQCILTILLVLVSAIGYFIVSPMPAKATDLCGQPLALAELLMGSYLQKGYVSTQVKVIEGNVTNSFLISQEEEAPPSKQERGKEEKWKEKCKEKCEEECNEKWKEEEKEDIKHKYEGVKESQPWEEERVKPGVVGKLPGDYDQCEEPEAECGDRIIKGGMVFCNNVEKCTKNAGCACHLYKRKRLPGKKFGDLQYEAGPFPDQKAEDEANYKYYCYCVKKSD